MANLGMSYLHCEEGYALSWCHSANLGMSYLHCEEGYALSHAFHDFVTGNATPVLLC